MSDLTTTAPHSTPVQASSDDQLITMWLHGRPTSTVRAYKGDVGAFLAFAGCDLHSATVGTIQAYADSIEHLAPAGRARRLSSIKSLLSFAHRLGYVTFNVGAAIRLPKVENTLAERIVETDTVAELLATETNARNKAILTLLYRAGLRIAEVAGLDWRHVQAREEGGQIAVMGKGGKTRFVRIGAKLYASLMTLKTADNAPDSPVFRSREGGHLDVSSIHRVVKTAGKRIGVADMSAHWLRHAHASHALDNGAPVHLVQATLGHASLSTTSRYAHARPNDSSERYLGGK